jgi:hypothetical protein
MNVNYGIEFATVLHHGGGVGYGFPGRSLDDHQVCHQNDHA